MSRDLSHSSITPYALGKDPDGFLGPASPTSCRQRPRALHWPRRQLPSRFPPSRSPPQCLVRACAPRSQDIFKKKTSALLWQALGGPFPSHRRCRALGHGQPRVTVYVRQGGREWRSTQKLELLMDGVHAPELVPNRPPVRRLHPECRRLNTWGKSSR